KLSEFSIFLRSLDFSSIADCCLCSMALERFIILAALWPIYPLSTFEPEFLVPFFVFSTSCDQLPVRLAESDKRLMSLLSFSFSANSKLSCRFLFSHQLEKLPF